MGCGSSGQVVADQEPSADGPMVGNGKHVGNGHHDDDLPTVVLPETPVKAKPPIAYEIPLEEFGGKGGAAATPPPHVQRLLQPLIAEIRLPDIEEKLAVAEQRRQSILQLRATSAQKRTQKSVRSLYDTGNIGTNQSTEGTKHGSNTLTIPPEPGVGEDKNI